MSAFKNLLLTYLIAVALGGCGTSTPDLERFSGMPQTQRDRTTSLQMPTEFTHLFSFSVNDGALPRAGLVELGGSLYGTTNLGGDSGCFGGYSTPGCGVVFKITPSGDQSAIYSFAGGSDGSKSFAPLIAVGGNLYGTTIKGGTYCDSSSADGCGTVFKITPSGKESVLYRFAGNNDGAVPAFYTPLLYVKGALYGITQIGGNGAGTLFKVTLEGKETVLYRFKNDTPEGFPQGLTFADDAFYGVSLGRSGPYSNDYGSVFKVTLSGKEKMLYKFKGSPRDGGFPSGRLAVIGNTLYGTTIGGGLYQCGDTGCGTIFSITLAGKEKVLHRFDLKKEGSTPYSGLISVKKVLYGTNCCSGPSDGGTAFKATTTGQVTILHAFSWLGKDGAAPYGALTFANGKLYGTTGFGGTKQNGYKYGHGTVFSLSP